VPVATVWEAGGSQGTADLVLGDGAPARVLPNHGQAQQEQDTSSIRRAVSLGAVGCGTAMVGRAGVDRGRRVSARAVAK
jgi:hypothetical protein